MGMIIDNSGSMREKRQGVESASLALVKDSNPQDEVFIVNFNDDYYMDADFTNDIKVLEQGLTKIDSRGGTAMRDAIRMSIDHLKEKAKRDKKVILVITDGNDNASNLSLDALVRLAQQDDVLIYAIGLLSEEDKRRRRAKAKSALDILVDEHRRPGLLPERGFRGGEDRPPGGARYPQPVHHRLYAHQYRARRHVSPDQGDGEGTGESRGPHPQRLLRYARPRREAGIEEPVVTGSHSRAERNRDGAAVDAWLSFRAVA